MEIKRRLTPSITYELREDETSADFRVTMIDPVDLDMVVGNLSFKQVETLIKDLGLIINRSVKLEEI